MGNLIVDPPARRCVIIGAAPNPDLPVKLLRPEDFIICADGGLDHALRQGITPDLTVGDYDSLQNANRLASLEHVTLPVEKDDTDTMAAIKIALERGFRDFLLLNCAGGRLDHTYANLTALFYLQRHHAEGLLIDGSCTAQILENERVELSERCGEGLSLFPFGCQQAVVSGEGVYYPLRSQCLQAGFPLGVSNRIVSDSAWIAVEEGTILMISEKR